MVADVSTLFVIIAAYLVGSFPVGFLVARFYGVHDIRRRGSGNIGATNVARVLGYHFFGIVFLLDCLKAFLFLQLISYLGYAYPVVLLTAVFTLIGNGFSLFLRGTGGKGVSTTIGIVMALDPILALLFSIAWIIFLALTRTAGVASVGASLLLPCYAFFIAHDQSVLLLYCFITVWIAYRHWDNIRIYYMSRFNHEFY